MGGAARNSRQVATCYTDSEVILRFQFESEPYRKKS